ncbi:MAG: hypothetical protein U9O20_01555 [Patescibacteria group bacterium]|nr:hypothetical protein [Patescibacteria group bacterium]
MLGGVVEERKAPLQALKRELVEESNIKFVTSKNVMQILNGKSLPVSRN